jgi:hypothetical protein
MNSQFNYELDERQIKILMLGAEVEYNDALWEKFDKLVIAKSKTNFATSIPTINLGISRSVIVPVLFIILIGGLSSLLFSFVDFKKKQNVDVEIPLIGNADNYKKTNSPPVKKLPVAVKRKSVVLATKPATVQALSATPITNTVTITKPEIKKTEELAKKPEVKASEEVIVVKAELKKEIVTEPKKKKKKLKRVELPIINTSTNLNEGAGEPELELK